MSGRVLVVEDDVAIAEGLALNLRIQGYRTEVVRDAESAFIAIRNDPPDLLLLDITLPGRSGLHLLEEIRALSIHVPVIVLSARQDEFDKVGALRLGADDYVTKPFALAELMARVAAVLRRSARQSGEIAKVADGTHLAAQSGSFPKTEAATSPVGEVAQKSQFGAVSIDLSTRMVTREGAEVKMTHLEFELLRYFAERPRVVLSRERLLRDVWEQEHGTPRTVDNFVAQLRAKLESDPEAPRHLVTVRGSGYRFEP